MTLTSDTLQISQGASLPVHAIVTNQNAYPVDDVSVYGKVFYKKDFNKSSFGPDVIQQFIIANRIDLKAGESRQVLYTWNVPAGLQPGKYQVAAYVASHDRFNLAGLSFTNDVVGNLFNFSVVGNDTGSVRFDNTKTIVNGTNYHSAIFSPQTDVGVDGVPVTVVVNNTGSTPFSGKIHWQLYSWDGLNPSNLITQSDQAVNVSAAASTTVSYTIKDSAYTVYYLLGELKSSSGEVLSTLPIRYVYTKDSGLDLPRLAFVGAMATSSEVKAFTCVHSTGHQASDNVRVVLTASPLDPVSWLLHLSSIGQRIYTGKVPTQLSAISVPLSGASGDFKVTAKLYQQGRLVDSVTSRYSCQDFNSCPSKTTYIIEVLFGLLVALLCVYVLRKRHSTPTP